MFGCAAREARSGGISPSGRRLAAALVVLALPAALRAQDTTRTTRTMRPDSAQAPAGDTIQVVGGDTLRISGQTHTVKRGDTLWDLAHSYLGDPFRWPEIYRVNRDVVEDPHWIYPGEVLRLPVAARAALAQQEPEPERQPSRYPTSLNGPTVFSPVTLPGQGPGGIGEERVVTPTVRPGEYAAAPFFDADGFPRGSGRLVGTADLGARGRTIQRDQFQLYEDVLVTVPSGAMGPIGTRYVSIAIGPMIENHGYLLIPTGILELKRPGGNGVASVARVVRAFGSIRPSDRLLPFDSTPAMDTVRPRPVSAATAPVTTVRWIEHDPVLPSIQQYIFLDAGTAQGVRMGDEYQLFEPRRTLGEGKPDAPEIPVARAQVVRVTPYGSTALITDQRQPAVRVGTRARLAARVP